MLHLQNVAYQVICCIAFEGPVVNEHNTSKPTYIGDFVTNVRMVFLSRGQYALLISFMQTNSHADPQKDKLILNQNLRQIMLKSVCFI